MTQERDRVEVLVPVKADNHELIRRDVLASKAQHFIFILYRTHNMHNWLSMTVI